jgi:hypothetical protein
MIFVGVSEYRTYGICGASTGFCEAGALLIRSTVSPAVHTYKLELSDKVCRYSLNQKLGPVHSGL